MNRHFLFRYSVINDGGPDTDRLVIFVAGRKFDQTLFAEDITNEINKRLSPDELIIIGRQTVAQHVHHALTGRPFSRLIERLGERAVITVIGYDHAGCEISRLAAKEADPSKVSIDDIWRRGGTEIFRRRGGFVESTNLFHFANPSGKHTNRFIRLSNILVVHAEIEFIAAATLHLIDQSISHIYIDTPSLFSVAAAINDIRATEGRLYPLSCDSFRSYDGVEKHSFDYPNAAVLISASSSGSLAKVIAKRGLPRDHIAHVLYLGRGAEHSRSAIDLGVDAKQNPDGYEIDRVEDRPGECRMCAAKSQPVPLRGDQFDIAGPQPKPLLLTQPNTPKTLHAVMTAHAGTDSFTIAGIGRAPCQIDASKLFSSSEGAKRRDYALNLHVPAKVSAILSVDEVSRELAGHVACRVSASVNVECLDEFEKRCPPTNEPLDPIVIVQAVVGSGRQITDLSRDLRRWPATPLVYIVGFLATDSEAKIKTLSSNLTKTWNSTDHRLVIIDQLSLPPNGEPSAWEAEAKLLDKIASTSGLHLDELKARRASLAKLPSAFAGDIFHTNSKGQSLELNAGFVFWPYGLPSRNGISQADVFVTISAVLQALRANDKGKPEASLTTAWYYSTVLDPENFGRYNDGIIQASLLRAARPTELDYRDNPEASSNAARLLRRILAEPTTARGDAAREFALALATGRMRLQKDHHLDLMELPSGDPVLDEILSWGKGLYDT